MSSIIKLLPMHTPPSGLQEKAAYAGRPFV